MIARRRKVGLRQKTITCQFRKTREKCAPAGGRYYAQRAAAGGCQTAAAAGADGTIRTTRAARRRAAKSSRKNSAARITRRQCKTKGGQLAKGYLGRRAQRNKKATEIRDHKQNIRPEQAKTMHRAELMDNGGKKLWWKARLYGKFMKQG